MNDEEEFRLAKEIREWIKAIESEHDYSCSYFYPKTLKALSEMKKWVKIE